MELNGFYNFPALQFRCTLNSMKISKLRKHRVRLLIPTIIITTLACLLAQFTFWKPSFRNVYAAVPSGLDTSLKSDYSIGREIERISPLQIGILRDILRDQGLSDEQIQSRFATLESSLLTPVPTLDGFSNYSGTPTSDSPVNLTAMAQATSTPERMDITSQPTWAVSSSPSPTPTSSMAVGITLIATFTKTKNPAPFATATNTPTATVTNTPDPCACIVTNTNDNGAGSLRQAIIDANTCPGTNTITFNIAGAGPHVIQPLTGLPDITAPVFIDGATQPGYAGMPIIVLNGTLAGDVSGLTLFGSGSNGSTIRGLVVQQFTRHGILLNGSSNNFIQGNFLGTDVTGTLDYGNSAAGIRLAFGSSNNLISGNLISGNSDDGIVIRGSSSNNVVQGNYIGTDITGTANIGNSRYGVHTVAGATNNTIGGTSAGAGNIIAFNNQKGVLLEDGVNSPILGNTIHSNGSLGIDLILNGVTANDGAGDADTGPNNLQNYPEITSATTTGSQVTIIGSLTSAINTTYRLEFFANSTADPSGHGEGQRYLGASSITTDASGVANLNATLSANVAVSESISATATDPNGNTSEFSLGVLVGVPPTAIPSNTPTSTPENTPTATLPPSPTPNPLEPEWSPASVSYAIGDRVRYNGIIYECLQAHTSQVDWAPSIPGVLNVLWVEIGVPTPVAYQPLENQTVAQHQSPFLLSFTMIGLAWFALLLRQR
jgi:parallel beta-helix repeat protein